MKKILIFILAIFLLVGVSATQQTLGTFELNEEINLIQTCSNCSFNNITAIISPDSTNILGNVIMTKEGTFYNYSFSNASKVGEYIINGIGDLDGKITIWNYNLFVTPSGFQFNTADSILSILIIVLTFILSVVLIWLAIVLPLSNDLDEKGNIIKINYFKYFKIFSIWFAHVFLAYFLTTFLGIMNNFYTLEITINLVEFLYRIMYFLLYPMTLLILALFFIFSFKDILWNKQIKQHGKAFIKQTN